MKAGIKTLVESYIHDNSEYINDNVANYLLENAENEENGYFFYLTEEEINLFESSAAEEKRLKKEVRDFIISNY